MNNIRIFYEQQRDCNDNFATNFITKGEITTKASLYNSNVLKTIGLLRKKSQEKPDEILVFCTLADTFVKGDVIKSNDVYYILYDLVKYPHYNKFKANVCNVSYIDRNGETRYGALTSHLRAIKDFETQQNFHVAPDTDAMLIVAQEDYSILDKIIVEDRCYEIKAMDDITNKPLLYLSVNRTTRQKEETFEEVIEETPILPANTVLVMPTEDGVFETSLKVRSVKKLADSVEFKIPFGYDYIAITTKVNGEEKEIIYKVVI